MIFCGDRNAMKDKFDHIKNCIEKLASIIEAPSNLLPTFGNSRDSHPNIEVSDNGQLSYEIFERGEECVRINAVDLDHLLFIVFKDIAYRMALKLTNEQPNIDIRRLQAQKELELLGKLNVEWLQKEKENQNRIAMQFPFDDYDGKRESYLRELLGNGFLYTEAIEKVKNKFPQTSADVFENREL